MINMTYAAISFATPTLVLSMSSFIKQLYCNRDFKASSICALYSMATENLLTLPLYTYSALKYSSDTLTPANLREASLPQALLNISKTTHFLTSSVFTRLALTSCPLYAIPAVVVILPMLFEQYSEFCCENSKKLSKKILAGDSFKTIIQDVVSDFVNRGLSHSAERG